MIARFLAKTRFSLCDVTLCRRVARPAAVLHGLIQAGVRDIETCADVFSNVRALHGFLDGIPTDKPARIRLGVASFSALHAVSGMRPNIDMMTRMSNQLSVDVIAKAVDLPVRVYVNVDKEGDLLDFYLRHPAVGEVVVYGRDLAKLERVTSHPKLRLHGDGGAESALEACATYGIAGCNAGLGLGLEGVNTVDLATHLQQEGGDIDTLKLMAVERWMMMTLPKGKAH